MQTFLPFPSFDESAACLDDRRLNKQRVEAYQILCCNLRVRYDAESGEHESIAKGQYPGWWNHPAVKMWRGHCHLLFEYFDAMNSQWKNVRGKNDGLSERIPDLRSFCSEGPSDRIPWWLGHSLFHCSHRANLFLKDSIHYVKFQGDALKYGEMFRKYAWPIGDTKVNGEFKLELVDGFIFTIGEIQMREKDFWDSAVAIRLEDLGYKG